MGALSTQAFVLAAAQCGRHNPRRETYGHAMIVDPWGTILAQCSHSVRHRNGCTAAGGAAAACWLLLVRGAPALALTHTVTAQGTGLAVAALDFEAQDAIRASIPCRSHRRPDVYVKEPVVGV